MAYNETVSMNATDASILLIYEDDGSYNITITALKSTPYCVEGLFVWYLQPI